MIGILAAMDIETAAILELTENVRQEAYYDQIFYLGTISNCDVVIAKCGVGKVASALTCARMIERYHCDEVINIGVAGGIKKYEDVLDVVIADKMTYHDWDLESIDGVTRSFKNNEPLVFHSSPRLVELARKTMQQQTESRVHIGPIVSGDAFIALNDTCRMIQKNFPEAVACDMESTSIGHVCTSYNVEFVIIRSLSDIVIREGNGMDFMTYAKTASSRSASFTRAFLAAH